MNQCCFILENQNTCSGKCKYGNYCYKHRRDYLLTNDTIIPCFSKINMLAFIIGHIISLFAYWFNSSLATAANFEV